MPSAPLLPISGLVNALSKNQVHVKPVTVDNLNSGNAFPNFSNDTLVRDTSFNNVPNNLNKVSTFTWWNRIKAMAEMGTICLAVI